MNDSDIARIRAELLAAYPGSHVKVTDDKQEVVAEVSGAFAVAVIERSQPHFHSRVREVYRVLRGTLHVACGGRGYLLHEGEELTIEPGQIHHARASGEPAWLEVFCEPDWTADDFLLL